MQVSFWVSQSQLLGLLSDYFVIDSPSESDTNNAYFYAMGLSLMSFLLALIHVMGYFQGYKLGMLTRILMCSVIYQKVCVYLIRCILMLS